MPATHRYFVLNKPYNMLSQFVRCGEAAVLGDLDFNFPEGTHAIGRLDNLSEGVLLLTTDKRVTNLLFNSGVPHRRTYLVRVKNVVPHAKLLQLRAGVTIVVDEGKPYTTPPCHIELLDAPPALPMHQLELRPRVPHSWLRISLYEGKYHQVRKMVKAVGHPCRRLVRESIEDITLGSLPPGCIRELGAAEFFSLLKIDAE